MKKIAVLGSSGSIGQNTLRVIEQFPNEFRVTCLTVRRQVDVLFKQVQTFHPDRVVVAEPGSRTDILKRMEGLGTRVLTGGDALSACLEEDASDRVVNALVGAVGLMPTLKAIEKKKKIALANKETLVMAGEIVTSEAKKHGVSIIPVDSEHSAIFQCLAGEDSKTIERIVLTGSGGPFLTRAKKDFKSITVDEALSHPNWSMGKKITIDSATLMNKGLEVIEARWLFQVPLEKIEIIIHPQSIIHSMVVFIDGSVKAQLGVPDMKLPIQYALFYPERRPSSFERLDFTKIRELSFYKTDPDKFPSLKLAAEALQKGGTLPAVLNGANEEAVQQFLEGKIPFNRIMELIQASMCEHSWIASPSIEEILQADRWSRRFVRQKI
ncbi:MAG TPA: 1-deoxy-D-xylulose-5-phosphate reductoisomerase [Bacteroidetes bacterium]|nr:1-deoxy-D-xylulose-5-phosphate reductoisomerase [Bacteroidota bacterium]